MTGLEGIRTELGSSRVARLFGLGPAIALGLVFAFLFLGPHVIDPRKDAWLLIDQNNVDLPEVPPVDTAYPQVGMDRTQHYLGWRFFARDQWHWPLGLNPDNGLEISSSIVYSDSIPLFALPAKLIAGLGLEFQYFGLWLTVCFVLQAVMAFQIIGMIRQGVAFRLAGTALILLSPILLWRAMLHMALAAHFLILVAIYLSLNNIKNKHLWWIGLLSVAVLVHFYLLLMVAALWIADMLVRLRSQITPAKFVLEFLVGISAICALGYISGYFTIVRGIGSEGFGKFSSNLLSPLLSHGFGRISLPIEISQHQVEGFAYLGAGAILSVLLALLLLIVGRAKIPRSAMVLLPMTASIMGMAALAFSHRLSLGLHVYEIPIPESVELLAALVRSSGRMIWPLIYGVLFAAIWVVGRSFSEGISSLILTGLVIVQLIDISPGISLAQQNLSPAMKPQVIRLSSHPTMACLAGNYRYARWLLPGVDNTKWREIALYALDNGMATDAAYLARADHNKLKALRSRGLSAMETGVFDSSSLYLVNPRFINQVQQNLDRERDRTLLLNGLLIVAPGDTECILSAFERDTAVQARDRNRTGFSTGAMVSSR